MRIIFEPSSPTKISLISVLKVSISLTREVIDESTGLASKMVVDWKQQAKNQSLNPRIEIHDKIKDGKILTLENGSSASYELPVDAILAVNSNQKVKTGDFIARLPKESSKTKQ